MGDEHTKPRPWGGGLDAETLFCTRERRLRYPEESAFTLRDIWRLADEYDALTGQLAALFRRMNPDQRALSRW